MQEELLVIAVKTTTSGIFGHARALQAPHVTKVNAGSADIAGMEMNISSCVTLLGVFLEPRSASSVVVEF